MISKVDSLLNNYENVLKEPWNKKLAGQEKVWFLVYDPVEQRKIALRIGDFERVTIKNNRNWIEVDLQPCFPEWMLGKEYRDQYFKQPEYIQDQIESGFKDFIINRISKAFETAEDPENTITAITNVSAMFGFLKLSDILKEIYPLIKGRILIFFPGEYQNNHFRLMDARDGWSYLARPITA